MAKKINILKIVREEFSGSMEDLIETADRAISKASFGVPPENLSKVIFSVPSVWSQNGKIEQNYLTILKNVCVSLALKPIGFVITSDAIVKFLESEDNLKINFLLLHIGETAMNLNNIERGNLVESISSLRSESGIGEDLLEMLSRFKSSSLPNKIIIFDGSQNLEILKQDIIKTPLTQKEKRFLHFPTVELLEENTDIKSVVRVVAEQMGVNYLAAKKDEKKEQFTPVAEPKENLKESNEEISKNVEVGVKSQKEIDVSEEKTNDLGFFYETENFKTDEQSKEQNTAIEINDENNDSLIATPRVPFFRNFFQKKSAFLITGVITAIFLITIIFWFFFGRADIVLSVKTKDFKSSADIFLTSDGALKKENGISGKAIQVQIEGEMAVTTTGRKKTGEKAKGEVVIFNKNTDGSKTFKKGTTISDGNLNYVLDLDITIASASMQVEAGSETKIFGKETVKITAEKFGNEYNTEETKDWTVDNFAESSYSAHNERAIEGGTTKEVQVISESDKTNLQKKLEKSLEKSAGLKISEKIDKNKEDVLDGLIIKKIQVKQFSGDADEEARKLDLSMEIQYTSFSYQKNEARKILDKILVDKIPKNYFLNQNSIALTLDSFKQVENGYDLNFSYEARAVPKINISELSGKIKGSQVSSLDKIIKKGDVVGYSIKIWPPLPILSSIVPVRADRIKISIKY